METTKKTDLQFFAEGGAATAGDGSAGANTAADAGQQTAAAENAAARKSWAEVREDYRGEFDADGVPRMSDLEAVEFVCVEETRRAVLPMIYAVRNGSATYAGAQLFGLVHAYYDYLAEKTGAGDPDLILDPSSLSLPDVIDIPYYDYVSETSPGTPPAMLSLERFNRELKGVTKLFIALLEMEKR